MFLGYLLLFVLGLSIGSFFNVLILRYNPEGRLFDVERLKGRSHCPFCGHTLSPLELIPILSFLFLKGKCLNCHHKISFFYPLTEVLTGLVFAGVPFFLNNFYNVSHLKFWAGELGTWYYWLVFLWLLAFLSLILIALIDLKYYVIPNELNLFLFIFGILITILIYFHQSLIYPFRTSFLKNYSLIFSPTQNVFENHLWGALAGGLFFWLLVLISKGKGMGFGDVKLAFALGAVFGWPDIALTIILSFVLGGIFSVLTVLLKKKNLKDKLPFAPFLVFCSFLVALLGQKIIFYYFQMFNF
jgi:leader peptidase (prepilin peptidase)/N-methyltransferase